MIRSTMSFSVLETNEIFAKDQQNDIIQTVRRHFGEPTIFTGESGYTSIDGRSRYISEKKWIWEISDLDVFLKNLDSKQINSAIKDIEQDFPKKIHRVYLIGLCCKELPYFQLMIYAQLTLKTDAKIIGHTAKLAIPFQMYLQTLNGLSTKVYQETIKPRCHMHHVINSVDYLRQGQQAICALRLMQRGDAQDELRSTEHSASLRKLPVMKDLPYPTILSAINVHQNVLSLVTHYEQFGGGGELHTCGVTIQDPQNDPETIMSSKQQVSQKIRMFSPNLDVFNSPPDAINLHLILSGLLTWLSFFEITRNNLAEELEEQRERIQILLNENNMRDIINLQDQLARLQGNYASMGLLLNYVQNQIINPIRELSSRKGMFGIIQTPIPQKSDDLFSFVFNNRNRNQAYFELIGNRIINECDEIADKLSSVDNPTNRMNGFLYNQSNLKLQNTINKNSWINIGLTIIIGVFAGISAITLFW